MVWCLWSDLSREPCRIVERQTTKPESASGESVQSACCSRPVERFLMQHAPVVRLRDVSKKAPSCAN